MTHKCFFCEAPADRIIFYSKYYPHSDRDTIENPTLCCPTCWANGTAQKTLFSNRGGMECVSKFLFSDISKWTKKNIGRHLSNKGYEVNQMANKAWRKTLWHIHYSSQEPKRRIDGYRENVSAVQTEKTI